MNTSYDRDFMTTQYIEAIEHGLKENMTASEIAELLRGYDESNFRSRVENALSECISAANEPGNDRFEVLIELKEYITDE